MQQTPYPEKIRKKIEHVIEILKYGKLTNRYTKILGNMEMLEIDSNNPNNNVVSIWYLRTKQNDKKDNHPIQAESIEIRNFTEKKMLDTQMYYLLFVNDLHNKCNILFLTFKFMFSDNAKEI